MKLHRRIDSLKIFLLLTIFPAFCMPEAKCEERPMIKSINRINPHTAEIIRQDDTRIIVDFYADNIFRFFRDGNGGIPEKPKANPEAEILVQNPRRKTEITISETDVNVSAASKSIKVSFDRTTGLMTVSTLDSGNKPVIQECRAASFGKHDASMFLKENDNEFFYGGGVQNGRFSHKGKLIKIENQNSWTDGGVASPAPFFWSTAGYGAMWYTFKKGEYDFGAESKGTVRLTHATDRIDIFFMIDDTPEKLLAAYYTLTGKPVLMPKFAFYEGHLNAYNRDYWTENEEGILFEDGKRYKESQKDNGGIKESLNGENDNYQFSARAVIDRYRENDMPLGWILPNDGYGAGYGQTGSLDGNIENLRQFGEYARNKGVEIGLWTQSDLHPKEGVEPLLQRDIIKEVRDAGVRVLKTDVAWVGWGYSFGLNGISDVAEIMPYYGNNARPFIITLDGWAGTQRYAGVWSGDQTGGEWEYIRFHIPTYIGSGLSGQPNICSDMDGIFGGLNGIVNTRDFQWKTFSIMQLNMDGWGKNEKYPHALGEPYTSINRMYLKLKSVLLPYAYSYAAEAVNGKPLMRAMFIDYPNRYTYGTSTEYQYMFGKDFLVAPVYMETEPDENGNDIRDGIYLPEGLWYDYFSGDAYNGECVLNNFYTPIWKTPVFVRAGAIIPMNEPNNNPSEAANSPRIYQFYPYGYSSMTHYDDDGKTCEYMYGKNTSTLIECLEKNGKVTATVRKTEGSYDGFRKDRKTEFIFNLAGKPDGVSAKYGNKKINLKKASGKDEFEAGEDIWYYDDSRDLNMFSTEGSEFGNTRIIKNPVLIVKLSEKDITAEDITVNIKGYEICSKNGMKKKRGQPDSPSFLENITTDAYSITPEWTKIDNADYYEIEYDGITYTGIRNCRLKFGNLEPEKEYSFKLRAVNAEGTSQWREASFMTDENPLENAITGINAKCTKESQGGFEIYRLVDFAESGDMWHTKYRMPALPYSLTFDLNSINVLDRFEYLPRPDGGNGTILKGKVFYSRDNKNWTESSDFQWERNGKTKVFHFAGKPSARYIRIEVEDGVNNYGSGREIYVFREPGTSVIIPGDINKDGKVDENDMTSYMNYIGVRMTDSDYDYIKDGDINCNGMIDVYDVSAVAVKLEGGADLEDEETTSCRCNIEIRTDRESYGSGDIMEVTVLGKDMKGVNAIGFTIPYNADTMEYAGIENLNMGQMNDFSKDRLHTDGTKALHAAFVNLGDKPALEGDKDLFIIKFRIKKDCNAVKSIEDLIFTDKYLQ